MKGSCRVVVHEGVMRLVTSGEIAIGKGVASVAVEAAGSKRSWREVEAWYHVSGSESLKRGPERLLVKVRTSYPGGPSIWRC